MCSRSAPKNSPLSAANGWDLYSSSTTFCPNSIRFFEENPKRLLANEQPLEIPVVSDDYDDDLPKNPFLRAMYRFFTGHRRDEEDED